MELTFRVYHKIFSCCFMKNKVIIILPLAHFWSNHKCGETLYTMYLVHTSLMLIENSIQT